MEKTLVSAKSWNNILQSRLDSGQTRQSASKWMNQTFELGTKAQLEEQAKREEKLARKEGLFVPEDEE